jgi:hypothetical protein
MMTIESVATVLALAALLIVGVLMVWLTEIFSRSRMMRCPETGAIKIVRVVPVRRGEGRGPGVAVQQCDSWPERKGCTQGCLARYSETGPGLQVSLDALRPFEPK